MCITLDVVVAKKGQDIMEGELGRSDAYKCNYVQWRKLHFVPRQFIAFVACTLLL